jgi:oligopeptide transport system substrate-binding protein
VPAVTADIGKNLDFNTNAATKLLADAGFPDGKGFPNVSLMIVSNEPNRLTATFLQEQLRKNLGIKIEIDAVDESEFGQRYQTGDFQLTWASWFADYADPENWLPQQFSTDGGFNVFHYSNPQVDELLRQASTELNQQERLALYNDAHKLLIEDQAVTPVFHPERTYLVKHNVDGLNVTPLDAEPGDWFAFNVQILAGGSAPPASDPDK